MRLQLFLIGCVLAHFATEGTAEEQTWIVAIGVGKNSAPFIDLPCAAADAALIRRTFYERGLVPVSQIQLLSNREPTDQQPTGERIKQALSSLDQAGETDHVVVYYAGHGYRNEQSGKTYLVPQDAKQDDLEASCLPVSELLAKLRGLKCRQKVLIIDACHSGSTSGVTDGRRYGVTREDLENEALEAGVYTLVSCQAEEESVEGGKTGHGLYTYWLARGLEGLADDNEDGKVSADEVNHFAATRVKRAAARLNISQQPGRIVSPNVTGDPVLIDLAPEPYRDALSRLAELLHEEALTAGVKRVGIFSFLDATARPNALGGESVPESPLGQHAGLFLESRLKELAVKDYIVIDSRLLMEAARDEDATLFTNAASIDKVSQVAGGLDAYVSGSFTYLPSQQRIRLVGRLTRRDNEELIASSTSSIRADGVTESFVRNRSIAFAPPKEPFSPGTSRSLADSLKPLAPPESISSSHPLLDPKFPYRLEVWSRGVPKKLSPGREPNELVVYAEPNEEFELRVQNGSEKPAFVRIMIDGKNVLGAKIEEVDHARSWIFPAKSTKSIPGWYRQKSSGAAEQFDVTPFVFIEPPTLRSVKRTFGSNIGDISAYFYRARPMAWVNKLSVGEVESKRFVETFPKTELGGLCLAEPLAAIHIRYVREQPTE